MLFLVTWVYCMLFLFHFFFSLWKRLYFVYCKAEFSYVFVSQGFQIVVQWKFKMFPYLLFVSHFYATVTLYLSCAIAWCFQSPLSSLVSEYRYSSICSTLAKIILTYIVLIRCFQFKGNHNKYIDCVIETQNYQNHIHEIS